MAKENVAALDQQIADLEAQFQGEVDKLAATLDGQTEQLEVLALKPTKSNIAVKLVALAWLPSWRSQEGSLTAASWRG